MESDALCLHALATQVYLETYATSGIRSAIARDAQAQFCVEAFRARLNEPALHTCLAELEGSLVAFGEVAFGARHVLVASPTCAELTRLYVQSPFLGRGVGKRLLQHSEMLALAEGASTLWLTAWVGNKRALNFYERQGYEALGRTEYVFEGEAFENRLFARELGGGT